MSGRESFGERTPAKSAGDARAVTRSVVCEHCREREATREQPVHWREPMRLCDLCYRINDLSKPARGSLEQRRWERLRFLLIGRWSPAVVAERLMEDDMLVADRDFHVDRADEAERRAALAEHELHEWLTTTWHMPLKDREAEAEFNERLWRVAEAASEIAGLRCGAWPKLDAALADLHRERPANEVSAPRSGANQKDVDVR